MKLEKKVAVITGGGRGIGEAIAYAFAREGASLVLASRTASELDRVAAAIKKLKSVGTVHAVSGDVSKKQDAKRIAETALDQYGRIDILINAAGVYGPIGPTWEVDVDDWMKAFQINLFGTFLCCHAILPHMIQQKSGKIVNFSGGGATFPLPRFTAYGVSKTAIVRLTETLAEEVKEHNIDINAIAPGAVDTRLQDDVLAAKEKAGDLYGRIQQLRETGNGGVPKELPAELVVYLASDRSRGLSGKLIAAPHDGWESWNENRLNELMSAPWFTLRRMDPHTLKPLVEKLKQ